LDIVLTFPVDTTLGGIRLWNFNKSMLESVKGFKEVELLLNDIQIWTGTVARGNGHVSVKNCTEVKVGPDFVFPSVAVVEEEAAPEVNVEESMDARPGSGPQVWY
jgi:hypothetical protein